MDMKSLNLQNRTFAIIENGSWAVKSGDLMQKFVNNAVSYTHLDVYKRQGLREESYAVKETGCHR